MKKIHPVAWIALIVIVVGGGTALQVAVAMERANAAAAESARLDTVLKGLEADTARFGLALIASDEAKALQFKKDSVKLVALSAKNTALQSTFDALVAADSVHAEGVGLAVTAMEDVLDEEHLPVLRRLTGAYETRILGLSSQVSVQQERIVAVIEERDIARADAEGERESRKAADVMLAGLRATIDVQAQVVRSKDVEIDALRTAVAPGFFTRMTQNVKLVAVTATVVYVVTR